MYIDRKKYPQHFFVRTHTLRSETFSRHPLTTQITSPARPQIVSSISSIPTDGFLLFSPRRLEGQKLEKFLHPQVGDICRHLWTIYHETLKPPRKYQVIFSSTDVFRRWGKLSCFCCWRGSEAVPKCLSEWKREVQNDFWYNAHLKPFASFATILWASIWILIDSEIIFSEHSIFSTRTYHISYNNIHQISPSLDFISPGRPKGRLFGLFVCSHTWQVISRSTRWFFSLWYLENIQIPGFLHLGLFKLMEVFPALGLFSRYYWYASGLSKSGTSPQPQQITTRGVLFGSLFRKKQSTPIEFFPIKKKMESSPWKKKNVNLHGFLTTQNSILGGLKARSTTATRTFRNLPASALRRKLDGSSGKGAAYIHKIPSG